MHHRTGVDQRLHLTWHRSQRSTGVRLAQIDFRWKKAMVNGSCASQIGEASNDIR